MNAYCTTQGLFGLLTMLESLILDELCKRAAHLVELSTKDNESSSLIDEFWFTGIVADTNKS